jgi:hypothetical protein
MWPGLEALHSSPSNAEVKIAGAIINQMDNFTVLAEV